MDFWEHNYGPGNTLEYVWTCFWMSLSHVRSWHTSTSYGASKITYIFHALKFYIYLWSVRFFF